MEKEKYQELSPEEVKKFEEENMTDTEREMSEEKARKFEQKEQMSPILIIYRDNDLFEKYVPEIERMLTAQGRRVEVKNFPRGTDENEIEEWYKENLERLTGTEIISDLTAGVPYISSEFCKSIQEKGIKEIMYLDSSLINQTIKTVIWGKKADTVFNAPNQELPLEQQRSIEDQRWNEIYPAIMKRILENQENVPRKVYIFSDRILDHINIPAYTGMTIEEQEENPEFYERRLEELEKMFPDKMNLRPASWSVSEVRNRRA